MKAQIFIPAMALLMLMAGQVNAQDSTMPGPTNGRPTESDIPMAPGNPFTSTTVVTPIVPNDNDTMVTPDTDMSTGTLNSITPSSGTTAPAVSPCNSANNNTATGAPPCIK